MNSNIEKLTEHFKRFPGVGPRQAKRFVYFLLKESNGYSKELISLVVSLKNNYTECSYCHRFFKKNDDKKICENCNDVNADKSLLLVVEKDIDLENIKRSGAHRGLFFILGGLVPILDGSESKKTRSKELYDYVETLTNMGLKEVILAFGVNPEGENTTIYLSKILEPFKENRGIVISVLGRGLSTGLELEYSDERTISSALSNRKKL